MTRYEIEMKPLLDHGKQQHGLQHGEGCADAYPRTPAKREIGESRDFSRPDRVFTPALRIKFVRIREETRVALSQRLKDEDIGAGGHAVPANFAVCYGAASNAPNGGIEPHRFLEDHFGVAQKGKMLHCRFMAAEYSPKFFDELSLNARVLGE